jgi:hypothetical protein
MQIHEITRRTLSEAGFAGGLATGLAGALNKVGVAGPDTSAYQDPKLGGDNSQLAAYKATAGLVKTLTTTMQSAWAQTIKSYLEQSKDEIGNPVVSVAQLDPATLAGLQKDLTAMINKTINPTTAGWDYESMGNRSNDPEIVGAATEIKNSIRKNAEKIYQLTTSGRAKTSELTPLFQDMVTNGIAPAKNLQSFTSEQRRIKFYQDPSGNWIVDVGNGPVKFDINNPEHKEVWDAFARGQGKT